MTTTLTRRIRSLLASLALLLAVATPGASFSATGITLGSVAPNFTKTELSGSPVSLSDYAGKVVVLFLLGYS